VIKDSIIKKLAIALFTWSALAGSSYAQDESYERLKSLPIDQAYAEYLKTEEAPAEGTLPVGIFYYLARFNLAQLQYPVDLRDPTAPLTDPDIIAVIREFEKRAGLEVDGSLTWGELERLGALSAWNYLTRLSLIGSLYVGSSPTESSAEVVSATGSWSMPDNAFPLNYSDIRCDLSARICEESIIWVFAPNITELKSSSAFYSIASNKSSYEIDSWRDGILGATATSLCRQTRLSINTNTDLATVTTQDLSTDGCSIPNSESRLTPIRGLRVSTLIEPREATDTYFDAIEGIVAPVRGPLLDVFVPTP
jgi:hypothetical protein